jgi:hypothetical protein
MLPQCLSGVDHGKFAACSYGTSFSIGAGLDDFRVKGSLPVHYCPTDASPESYSVEQERAQAAAAVEIAKIQLYFGSQFT